MSVREYIGSRYVPIFGRKDESTIEWDNTKPYEPLTIVLYEGNSYTSRQYVPADIDITNQLYWAQTGNYNAQVEAYRNEVTAYNGRITALEGDMNDLLEVPGGKIDNLGNEIIRVDGEIADIRDDISALESEIANPGAMMVDCPINDGTATLIRCDNNAKILIDCGLSNSSAGLNSFLSSRLGSEKLDVLIISHFHPDHAGGDFDDLFNPANVRGMDIALSYCDASTRIYMQMQPTGYISSGELDAYNFYLGELQYKCSSLGLSAPAVPVNNQIVTVNGAEIRMFNTDPALQSNYGGKSDNGYSNTAVSLNNFSIITYITYKGNVYANLADIETPAQVANISNITAANLAMVPHHARNVMGYKLAWDKINTNVWHYTKAGTTDDDINSAILTGYLFRYATQIRPLNVWTNRGTEFGAVLMNGDITTISGYSQNMMQLKNNGLPHNINSFFPPANVYTLQPWDWWTDKHLDDFNDASAEFNEVISTRINGDVPFEKTCPAYDEMCQIFQYSLENADIDKDNNSVIYFEIGSYPMRMRIANSVRPLNEVEVWNGFDMANFPNTNWRICDNTVSICRNVTGLNWQEGNNLNNADVNRLLRNDMTLVRVYESSGEHSINVPVFKTAYDGNNTWEWRGVTGVASGSIITVYINGSQSTKTLGQCRWINTINNTSTECKVVAMLNPYSL